MGIIQDVRRRPHNGQKPVCAQQTENGKQGSDYCADDQIVCIMPLYRLSIPGSDALGNLNGKPGGKALGEA